MSADDSQRYIQHWNKVKKETMNSSMMSAGDMKKYIKDMQNQTNSKITKKQLNNIKENIRNNVYLKMDNDLARESRRDFGNVKKKLINKWEQETGQKWPKYTQNVINPHTGKVSRIKDALYDAHEIIPNAYGGPKEWWNIIPAKFSNEHQGGIHRKGGIWRTLFPDL